MNNTAKNDAIDTKRMKSVAVVGAIASVFVLAGLGFLGRAVVNEGNQPGAGATAPTVPVSGTGLVVRSP